MAGRAKKRKRKQDLYVSKKKEDWKGILEFFYENEDWGRKHVKSKWIFRGDNPDPPRGPLSRIPEKAFRSSLEKAFEEFGGHVRNG